MLLVAQLMLAPGNCVVDTPAKKEACMACQAASPNQAYTPLATTSNVSGLVSIWYLKGHEALCMHESGFAPRGITGC